MLHMCLAISRAEEVSTESVSQSCMTVALSCEMESQSWHAHTIVRKHPQKILFELSAIEMREVMKSEVKGQITTMVTFYAIRVGHIIVEKKDKHAVLSGHLYSSVKTSIKLSKRNTSPVD